MDNSDQGEIFQATATWFHVFVAMFESGDVAELGPYAFTVYAAIKSHTNFTTGRAFPGIDTLTEKTGISKSEVIRALEKLEKAGYIVKEKEGRRNVYTLREKVAITDGEGRPAAVATWDYLPSTVREAQAELRKFMLTQDYGDAKIINIERFSIENISINVQHGDNNVNVQIGDLNLTPDEVKSLETIGDPKLRAKMEGIFLRSKHGRRNVENS